MAATVTAIAYTPVKGLALASHDHIGLEAAGVRANRRFYLVDADGRLLNGKRAGTLVQVAATTDPDGETLKLRFPDGSEVDSPVVTDASIETDFYGTPISGRLVDGPFAGALSEFAGLAMRLVRAERPGDGSDRGGDGSVSLVSQASLDRLAEEADVGSVDARRFRMLFTIDGTPVHEEDGWIGRRVAIGDAVVRLRDVVGRCAVTSQDPDTGVPDLDTLRLLARYRPRGGDEPLPLGVWGGVEQPGTVRVGDRVEPL